VEQNKQTKLTNNVSPPALVPGISGGTVCGRQLLLKTKLLRTDPAVLSDKLGSMALAFGTWDQCNDFC
jgi:hypothetical protein